MISEEWSDRHGPHGVRERNLRLVLELFRRQGPLSVNQVARQVNLSKTTVSKLIACLAEAGQLQSVGKGKSTQEGGKRPELFRFHGGYAYIVSLLVLTDRYTGCLYDLACNRMEEFSVRPGDLSSYLETVYLLAHIVRELVGRAGISTSQLCGVAVGCGGVVDVERGLLLYPMHHNWGSNLTIRQDLKGALSISTPVYVDNACRFLGYGEVSTMADSGLDCVVTLYADITTGGCVVKDNQLIQGRHGYVGELGHIRLELDSGTKCSCGGYGCFEALVSPRNLLRYAGEASSLFVGNRIAERARLGELAMEELFEQANGGNPFARHVMDYAAKCFATLIHNIFLLHDPDKIIIQGIYAGAGVYFLESVRQTLASFPFYKLEQDLAIAYSRFHFIPGITDNFTLGGACYVADDYLRNRMKVG